MPRGGAREASEVANAGVTMTYKYTATARASSTHPHDWGRAMAVAIGDLVSQAEAGGDEVEHENLYGEELHLVIKEIRGGAHFTLTWTPKSAGDAPVLAASDGFAAESTPD